MFYQPSTPPPTVSIIQSKENSCKLVDTNINQENKVISGVIATPNLPSCSQVKLNQPQISRNNNDKNLKNTNLKKTENSDFYEDLHNQVTKIFAGAKKTLNSASDVTNLPNKIILPGNAALEIAENTASNNVINTTADVKVDKEKSTTTQQQQPLTEHNLVAQEPKTLIDKKNPDQNPPLNNILAAGKTLLVGVLINGQEVGYLEILPEGNTLFVPLENFAQITGIELQKLADKIKLKTPLGVVTLLETDLKKVDGITYISETLLKQKLLTNLELKTSDLALNVDLPWRRGSGESKNQAVDLQPEVTPPSNGLSNVRQELNFYNNSGSSSWRSSSVLGGRLAGGAFRLRLDNNFINNPQLTEYFYFKRSGQFLYQLGRQQLNTNPVLSGLNLTGLQFGYTNLPAERFNTSYSASELFPRRSQPTQAFRGVVAPASFVQLRVGGIIVAQQQVGLTGEYDFQDVVLPTGQSSEIQLLVFDRNNLRIPTEIRSLSLNSSDLLLPSGGNVQLAGLGVTGNWLQNNLFDNFDSTQTGRFASFYQVRQGISNDLTLEAGVQLLPETTQAQAGFAWRLASPLILSANVGTSSGELGYRADLDFRLSNWQVLGTSEFYPQNYFAGVSSIGSDRRNHSLDVSYKFSNNFTFGFIGRIYQAQTVDSKYILPTFSFRPANNLSFRGAPDYNGDYIFNASYQPTYNTRLLFNTFGGVYTSDFSYNLNQEYQLSFGTESGGDLATRYTLIFGRTARSLSGLSWRLGLGYRDGDIGPFAGASMRLVPGLYASIDYQGIPSRYKNIVGSFGDERLTVSLVSDLSFSGGRFRPSEYSSIGKDTGAIAGRIQVEGGRQNTDLSGGIVQVYNNRGRNVSSARIDSQGNFSVGNLREGVYVVQLDPDELPIEINLRKTSIVAEVASSAVTQLNFPVKLEYGLAGKITDVSGQPMSALEVQLINALGQQVATTTTDQFGLYRMDGVPVGKYTLRVPSQEGIKSSEMPKLDVAISKEFVYDQNLQLPISAAVKVIEEKSNTPNK